jgi:predicted ATP-grasp superfamily ATP-dependent carboligase
VKRPVLVVGWVPRIVCTIARSLHSYRVPVDVADFALKPRVRSRAIRHFVRLPNPDQTPEAFADQLHSFITRYGHDMLIPADDQALVAVMEHYDRFKDVLHIACPPPHILRLVLNKSCTLEIAQKCGIQVPRTMVISQSSQLSELISSIPFPWILKPTEKLKHEEAVKSCLLKNANDLVQRFPQPVLFSPPMLLQEYCEGAGVGIEMLIYKGECSTVFQHRRLKELPYDGGFAVTAVAEHPDPALVKSSLALLRALHWDGVAMVEYKVNPADGRAVLMEVNGRYWGTISLPVISGIDFPLYHWKLVHGASPGVPNPYPAGMKWRWTAGYFWRLHGLLEIARHSESARKALSLDLRSLTADFGFAVRDAVFRLSDPMPAVGELLFVFRYIASDAMNILARRLRRRNSGGSSDVAC